MEGADCQLIRLWGGRANTDMALARYRMTGHWDGTPATDNGTDTSADILDWVAAPIVDLDGKAWPIGWASVNHQDEDEIKAALARFPLRITIGLPAEIAQDPERWSEPPRAGWTPDEGHEVVLGFETGAGWLVRSWGLDYQVHPDLMRLMLLAVDVPIPHPQSVPPELQMAGEDFGRLMAG